MNGASNGSAGTTAAGQPALGAPLTESPPLPRSKEELRGRVSYRRWRIYQAVEQILGELEQTVDWEKLYDLDGALGMFLSWGLYLEECLPGALMRIRAVLDEAPPAGSIPEAHPEELEDNVRWGTRQIEVGMHQALSMLSKEMVELITAGPEGIPADQTEARKQALCIAIADTAGKLRSDLRRFAAYMVAGGSWDSDEIEVLLFPQKMQELEQGQQLKAFLVETMEGFQGSDRRLPISDVIRLWRQGKVLGTSALFEIDTLLASLGHVLATENRRSLYVDSFYRLARWRRHLDACSEGLKQHLGDETVEDTLTKEMAAILDVETLAEILGEESLRSFVFPRHLPQVMELVSRQGIKKLEMNEGTRARLLEIKDMVEAGLERDEQVILSIDDDEILRTAAKTLKGRKVVDQLRIQSPLPESLAHLGHLHELVLDSEDGLKTYLMLLYGQIQNRDLHLLKEDQKEVSLAEKRLAVAELEYHLSKLGTSEGYRAFEAGREKVAAWEPIPPRDWQAMRSFLHNLSRELARRLERIAAFEEITGIAPDHGARLRAACKRLGELENAPAEQTAEIGEAMTELVGLLRELANIEIVVAPPQTVSEIEDFLNMMG